MFDRRQFLIGAGGLLTTAFVNRAKGFSRRHYEPLLLPTAPRPEETLYLNSGFSGYAKWRASLGPIDVEAPPLPTWREHLRALGVSLETDGDVRRACDERGMGLQDLDKLVDAFGWEDRWDNFTGPQARAHHLLKSLDFGPPDSPLRRAGAILFEEFGGGPGNDYTWVELKDDLTASLLQARLIELHLPINVEIAYRGIGIAPRS
jgi:hypothetical protein